MSNELKIPEQIVQLIGSMQIENHLLKKALEELDSKIKELEQKIINFDASKSETHTQL